MAILKNAYLRTVIFATLLAVTLYFTIFHTCSAIAAEVKKFEKANIVVEQNFTDDDAEIVIFAKGIDEGLAKLKVFGPSGTEILRLSVYDKILGVREFAVESAEPNVTDVLNAYPAGRYRFEGLTISGIRLEAVGNLSHVLPKPAVVEMDKTSGTVSWAPVSGVKGYRLEFEREVKGQDVLKLTLDLPSSVTDFQVPKVFLGPGDYQVGIAAISRNGNIVVVEKEFSINK